MPFTEEDKILINNLFDLKGYNGKHLARVFQQRLERSPCLLFIAKSTGYLLGRSTIVPAAADDTAPTQLITLILLTYWCYTKIAKGNVIFAHCT